MDMNRPNEKQIIGIKDVYRKVEDQSSRQEGLQRVGSPKGLFRVKGDDGGSVAVTALVLTPEETYIIRACLKWFIDTGNTFTQINL